MSALLTPGSIEEVAEAVRSSPRLLAVGNQTKPRLSHADATKLCLSKLQGILEYEPSEFTFTALAGTPVREVIHTLAQRGQYLPFDPLLVEAGATLGGTVAAGLSGPGRFRFGGLRDFILGARFVDGMGRALRLGGKVVKNAAGFDLPKFFVGSLGRLGVLAELTFKVFPSREATLTCSLTGRDLLQARQTLSEVSRSRFEVEALDIAPGGGELLVRIAGPASALERMADDLLARWPGQRFGSEQAEVLWGDLREFRWAHPAGPLVKVPMTPEALPEIFQTVAPLGGLRIHVSSGGNVAFISLPDETQVSEFDQGLRRLSLQGLTLRGDGPLWWGVRPPQSITKGVKAALDPESRFPGLDD